MTTIFLFVSITCLEHLKSDFKNNWPCQRLNNLIFVRGYSPLRQAFFKSEGSKIGMIFKISDSEFP